MRCCSCLVFVALECLSNLVLALLFMNSVLVYQVVKLDARMEEMSGDELGLGEEADPEVC